MTAPEAKHSTPGSVRIIGGAWRRRRIAVPAGARPTPDRVRETLFNWLGPSVPGSVCLDLYAGTGVLGFEALSRGAQRAVLVDRDAGVVSALERQSRELGAAAEIVCADACEFIRRGDIGAFDIVFVDPPYSEAVDGTLETLASLLTSRGRVYLERERGDGWPDVAGFDWIRRASAGSVDFGLGRPGA